MTLLGSEIVVMSAEDARKLVDAFHGPDKALSYKHLQKLGILEVLNAMRDAVRRYDYAEDCFQGES